MSLAEQEIAAVWKAYQATERYGLEFGRVLCGWRDKFGAKHKRYKGQGLRPILDKLRIPHSTAYWWMDRYEVSINTKKPAMPTIPTVNNKIRNVIRNELVPAYHSQSDISAPIKALQTLVHAKEKERSVEWLSPLRIVEAARRVMGSIDVDPASNAANHCKATSFYTKRTNGLTKDWKGNVWLNPPYGDGLNNWIRKLNNGYQQGHIKQAITLIPARTSDGWFQELGQGKMSICFPLGKLDFINGETNVVATPTQFPSALVYIGGNHARFAREFREFGLVVFSVTTASALNTKAA